MMMRASDQRKALEAQVELIAQDLFKNESLRVVCPKCKGGSSSEKSFLCSRDHGGVVYFKCFRASCSFGGKVVVGSDGGGWEPRKRRLHQFKRDLVDLTPLQSEYWRQKFGINPSPDILWCPEMARYALRVYGPLGQHRGWVLRTFADIDPKVIGYPQVDEPFLGWYSNVEPRPPAIIVEDLISARKVCDAGFTGIALNGTHWGWDAAYEIVAWHPEVHLALDRGTMAMMIEYREQFGPLFERITIWNLDKDLKYVSRDRIRRAVNDKMIDFIGVP